MSFSATPVNKYWDHEQAVDRLRHLGIELVGFASLEVKVDIDWQRLFVPGVEPYVL